MIPRHALTLALILAGSSAAALPPLREVTAVREGLIATGIAVEIADKCDSIDARYLRGMSFLNRLESHARDLGYSQSEIDAFVDSDTERDALEAVARERLAGLGAVPGNAESYCAVGRAEISRDSAIGQLLR